MAAIEGLGVETAGGVLRLRLDRPERRNALTPEIVCAMLDALDAASADDGVRAVAITASGPHFCSGMDFRRNVPAGNGAPVRKTWMHRSIDDGPHRLLARLATIELPVVGAVRGHAAGYGLGLALACDFAVTSDTARFTAPFVGLGFTPDSGTSWLLPRAVGVARAREMLMLASSVDATTAECWGLVSRVVRDDDLDEAAEALVLELAAGATTALGLTKWLLHEGAATDLAGALRLESIVEDISTASRDGREGVRAFMEKRAPAFGGT